MNIFIKKCIQYQSSQPNTDHRDFLLKLSDILDAAAVGIEKKISYIMDVLNMWYVYSYLLMVTRPSARENGRFDI